MKVITETNLIDFEAWSGGRDVMNVLQERLDGPEFDALEEQILDAIDPEREGITDTQLNDFLWFESDTVAQLLGYADWAAFEKGGNDDDEEETDEDEEDDD